MPSTAPRLPHSVQLGAVRRLSSSDRSTQPTLLPSHTPTTIMYRAHGTQKPHHRGQAYGQGQAGQAAYYSPQQQPPYGNGGYRAPTGPPPGADPQLWQWFRAVDTDGSGGITATELQSALVNGAFADVSNTIYPLISFDDDIGNWTSEYATHIR